MTLLSQREEEITRLQRRGRTFEAQLAALREIGATVVLAPCTDCGQEWPHPSVLSSFPRCESCWQAQLAALRGERDVAIRGWEAAASDRDKAAGERDALKATVESARLREQGLREAATLVANSMGDVVTLGRFSRSVDPVRLVTAWHTDLCYAIHAALALPDAGDLRRALHRPDCQSLDYDRANCSCGATPALPEAGTPKESPDA